MSQNNDNIISIPLLTDTRPIDLVKHQKDKLPPETARPDATPQREVVMGGQQETTVPLDQRLNLSRETPTFDTPLPLPVFPDNQDIRSIVLDTLKNISINGISPQISGSSIAFNIPESTHSASQLWGLMNTANVLGDVSSSTQTYGSYVSQSAYADQPHDVKQTPQDTPTVDVGGTTNYPQPAVVQQQAASSVKTNEAQHITPKSGFDTPLEPNQSYLSTSSNVQSGGYPPQVSGDVGFGAGTNGVVTTQPNDSASTPTTGYSTPSSSTDTNFSATTSTSTGTDTGSVAGTSVIGTTTPATPSITTDTTSSLPVGPLTDALNNTYSGGSIGAPSDTTTNQQATTTPSNDSGSVIAVPNISSASELALSDEPSGVSDSSSARYDQPTTGASSSSVQHNNSGEPIHALQTADQANSESTQLLAVPFKRGDKGAPQMVYFVTAGYEAIEGEPQPYQNIKSAYGGSDWVPSDYWIPVGSGGGGGFPFEIIVESGSNPRYKISSNSSIINGINGGPFAINTLDSFKGISETQFIIAEATVTSEPFEITDDGFTIKEAGESETNEVVIDNGKQTKIRLLIGKILAKPIEGGGTQLEAHQAAYTSFRSAVNFHNGIPVYVLQAAPTHQSVLPTSID